MPPHGRHRTAFAINLNMAATWRGGKSTLAAAGKEPRACLFGIAAVRREMGLQANPLSIMKEIL